MGGLGHLFYPWGLILYAVAIVHFIRRRPEGYWLWIILFIPTLGAAAYIVMEVIPDLGLLRHSFDSFSRKKRIRHLEALVVENPAVGNIEELADLYLDEGDFKRAREWYDKAIASRASSVDAYYRRGIAKIRTGDYVGAVPDLEYIASHDAKYDSHRAAGLLAHAYANTGRTAEADQWFRHVTEVSTLSETYFNYADFLASQQRSAEAREWASKILQKKPTMPNYLRRRERPWFRKANALLKRLPA